MRTRPRARATRGAAAAGEVDEVGGARLPPGALGTALLQQHSPPAPPASGGASSDAVSGGGSAGGSALPPPPFTLVDVQKAAERDFRWLTMREALVAERLEALQAALGVRTAVWRGVGHCGWVTVGVEWVMRRSAPPGRSDSRAQRMAAAGLARAQPRCATGRGVLQDPLPPRRAQVPWHAAARAFLRQPSLLHRRPELLSARAASLAGLDGLGAARATRALLSMPALLNLGEAVVAGRWRALQQAADSHPPWRAQLDAAAPATAASMLVRSEARMARLVYLVESNQQGGAGSLKGVLDKGEAAFEGKFGGYAAWAAARGGGAAAGGGAGAAAAAGAGDAAEGDAAD
ncbi:MAG: hypothetical protein J3K34DRAFT_97908 [Monoraphidium minutum]|nr:MAG: hypothetical protein J3K34DRAFT_97908 [Monoraphidium minutum]